jgi:Bacteriophage HK97-gp10, putative tail-component
MAEVTWSHRLDLAAMRNLLNSPRGGVARDLLRRGLLVEIQAKRNLAGADGPKRIDTGRLRASINTQLTTRNGEPAVIVGTNVFYAKFVHDGTGIYGPRHTRIVPKRRRRLRFKPKNSARWVYARSGAGMRPNRFLLNALRAARR